MQEGEASVTVNGETKKLAEDDVVLVPAGAKLVAFFYLVRDASGTSSKQCGFGAFWGVMLKKGFFVALWTCRVQRR